MKHKNSKLMDESSVVFMIDKNNIPEVVKVEFLDKYKTKTFFDGTIEFYEYGLTVYPHFTKEQLDYISKHTEEYNFTRQGDWIFINKKE